MPAFLIGRMNITDPEAYGRYRQRTPAIIAKYGGRFVSRGGTKLVLEGPSDPRRVVVVEFPSIQHAKDFYHSREYQEAIRLRTGAADGMELILVEGFEDAAVSEHALAGDRVTS
jgi:uncharacterized protein (DUF1330 family)